MSTASKNENEQPKHTQNTQLSLDHKLSISRRNKKGHYLSGELLLLGGEMNLEVYLTVEPHRRMTPKYSYKAIVASC